MPLKNEIIAEIRANGPITVSRYMQLCLSHPKYGYYVTQNPLGRDFTTSPEISQIFGEVVGVWGYLAWQAMGSPLKYNLVEMGAGRGTLMRDALKVLAKTNPQIHIVDINPVLRKIQRETLKDFHVTWHDGVDSLEDIPTLIIANEFLDCLPVNQYVKQEGKWFEWRVGEKNGDLFFGLAPTHLKFQGNFYEDPIEFEPFFNKLFRKNRLKALFIDYGFSRMASFNSLQAMRHGNFTNPLESCGYADLTFHVNFDKLADAAQNAGFNSKDIITQNEFLAMFGGNERLQALIKANPLKAIEIEQSYARLTDISSPAKMGVLFKVLEIGS